MSRSAVLSTGLMAAQSSSELFVGQRFEDFKAFDAFFSDYCKRTQQIFCVAYGKTVELYNNKHCTKKLDNKLKYAYVKYQCKCGGKERHRGNGLRPVRRYLQWLILYVIRSG